MIHPITLTEQQLIKLIQSKVPESEWPENAKYGVVAAGDKSDIIDLQLYEHQPVDGFFQRPVRCFRLVIDEPVHIEDESVLTKKWLYMTEEMIQELTVDRGEKYRRDLKGVRVDVYDVLNAFGVTCSATQHAIKKLLMPGARGGKSRIKDLQEAEVSVRRAIELEQEREKNITAP